MAASLDAIVELAKDAMQSWQQSAIRLQDVYEDNVANLQFTVYAAVKKGEEKAVKKYEKLINMRSELFSKYDLSAASASAASAAPAKPKNK